MTKDKQIIIDGVDVNGCAYFWNKECRCTQDCIDYSGNNSTIKELFHKDTGIFADCENSPNCYYKQLKRKEQECEKAKQNAQDTYDLWQALIESFNILQGEKIKLEQECEELNKTITNLENIRDEFSAKLDQLKAEKSEIKKYLGISSKTILERLEELQEFRDKDRFELFELKQTLADIKEIAEKQQSWNEWNSKHSETESEDDIFAYNWSALKQILQKINEVEDDNTRNI